MPALLMLGGNPGQAGLRTKLASSAASGWSGIRHGPTASPKIVPAACRALSEIAFAASFWLYGVELGHRLAIDDP